MLATLFLLASCGGGGDDSTSDIAPPAEDQKPSYPVIPDIKYELSPSAVIVSETTAKQITNVNLNNCTALDLSMRAV